MHNLLGFIGFATSVLIAHAFPPCKEGEVQCDDGHCIPSHFLCDSVRDCSMGEDEGHMGLANCTTFDHGACETHETQFQCNDGSCIHADYHCDQVYDCLEGEDELDCSRPCTEHEFECPGQQCIPLAQRCDFYLNCLNGIDDELDCATPETTEDIILTSASGTQVLNISSPDYPKNYPLHDYILFYITTNSDAVIRARILDFDVSVATFLVFVEGFDTSDSTATLQIISHGANVNLGETIVESDGNTMAIEFHSGFYNHGRGFHIELSSTYEFTCNSNEFQCNDNTCVHQSYECDGYWACQTGEDEHFCQAPEGGTCPSHQFTCNDGTCITATYKCDYYPDCPEGDDENDCP